MEVVMKRATLLLTTLLASISMSAATFANEGKNFEDIDKDGDQNISQQELQDAGKENVDMNQVDSDSDGVLSKEEYENAKSMWKDKKKQ
jgi:hypothetical protein